MITTEGLNDIFLCRPANIILYTGLGMAATGMLLISLGAGEHGFKSSYLFILGPGLLILGKAHMVI